MFLLDTDYAVLLQRGESAELRRLLERMSAYADSDFHYPVIAFHEQMLGANFQILLRRLLAMKTDQII